MRRPGPQVAGLDDLMLDSGFSGPEQAEDVLAGFDAVVQFSVPLLGMQLVRSLMQKAVSPLAASAPWGTVPLPPALADILSPYFLMSLAARDARLELRLIEPHIAGLHWPDIIAEPGGPLDPGVSARLIGQERIVDVGWRLEINVLTRRLGGDTVAMRLGPPGGPVRPPRGPFDLPETEGVYDPGTSDPPPPSGPSWDRSLMASARVVTKATAQTTTSARLWRFGMVLDFAETAAAVSDESEAVTAFLALDGGAAMLAEALAPLRAAADTRLTPEIAPAGALSPSQVQWTNLPPFEVTDMLLADDDGRQTLALCAQLGQTITGVRRLVLPRLKHGDFVYAASSRLLGPALKARWFASAINFSIVRNYPLEVPVSEDSDETEPALAQFRLDVGAHLEDVAIMASTDSRGDPLRLLARQTIRMLHFWDADGKEVTDLGELGEPQQSVFALPLYFFDTGNTGTQSLDPRFKDLVLRMMTAVVFPMLEGFPVSRRGISGFASSALRTMLVRWALRSRLEDVVGSTTGTVGASLDG